MSTGVLLPSLIPRRTKISILDDLYLKHLIGVLPWILVTGPYNITPCATSAAILFQSVPISDISFSLSSGRHLLSDCYRLHQGTFRVFCTGGECRWWAAKHHVVNARRHKRWDQIWSSGAAANKMCLKRRGSLFSCVSLWEGKTKTALSICVIIYRSVPGCIRCRWIIIIFWTFHPCRHSTFQFRLPICVSLRHKRRQHCLFWQNEANVFISGRWMMSKRHIYIHLGARRRRTHL